MSTDANKGQTLIRAAQATMILLLILAPIPFGSVQDFWILVIELGVLFAAGLWLATQIVRREFSIVKTKVALPLFLLMAYITVTFSPIPPKFVALASSQAHKLQRFVSELHSGLGKAPIAAFRISLAPFQTEGELLKLAAYAAFFLLTVHLFRYHRGYLILYRILIILGSAIGLFGIIQNVWWNGKIYWVYQSASGTPFGPFDNHNHFAGYLELALGLAIGMSIAEIQRFRNRVLIQGPRGYCAWIYHKEGGRVWAVVLATFIMVAALPLSLSRGGVLSFLTTAFLFSGIVIFSGGRGRESLGIAEARNRTILAVAGLCVAALIIIVLVYTPNARGRVKFDDSATYRLRVWRDSLHAIQDFPIMGAGLGAFRTLFPRYKSGILLSEVTHAENEYVQWLMETGIAGTALILWAALIFVRRTYFRFKSRRDKYARTLAGGILFSITSISLHNFMDYNAHIPSNALTLAALIALSMLVLNVHHGKHEERFMLEVVHIPVWSARGTALGLSFLLAIGFFAYRAYAHCQSSHLEKLWDEIRPYPIQLTMSEDRLTLLSASIRWSPLNSRAHYLKALSMEAGSAKAGLFEFALRQDLTGGSETQILEAIRLEPANATYWALLGRLETGRQNFEISRFAFENALDLARTDGFIHRDFGLALIQQGDVRNAASRFLLARTYTPIIALGELLEVLGRQTGDRAVWENIVKYEPSDLRIYADFLGRHALPDLRAQFLKQAEELERKREGALKRR